mmetsp:Transcript_10142/g.17950  ORF Transcript_10142/g.17950 Transcript_10142/m.17950 type:complete len:117 (+) Transcript_10142:1271-1621(+)
MDKTATAHCAIPSPESDAAPIFRFTTYIGGICNLVWPWTSISNGNEYCVHYNAMQLLECLLSMAGCEPYFLATACTEVFPHSLTFTQMPPFVPFLCYTPARAMSPKMLPSSTTLKS